MGGGGAANGAGRHVLRVDTMAKGGVCCKVYGGGAVVYTGRGFIISKLVIIRLFKISNSHVVLPFDQGGCNYC